MGVRRQRREGSEGVERTKGVTQLLDGNCLALDEFAQLMTSKIYCRASGCFISDSIPIKRSLG